MPRNSSGTYTLPQPPFVANTVISSAAVNSNFSDIATALTDSLPRDGSVGMTGQFRAINGGASDPGYAFDNDTTTGFGYGGNQINVSVDGTILGSFTSNGWTGPSTGYITGKGGVPVGTVIDFLGTNIPAGWLMCYGQAISRTTYSALFNAIGTTYGSGDGSTTFNLPDLRGRAVFGLDNMGGTAAGRLTSTYFTGNPSSIGGSGGGQSHALVASEIPTINSSGTNMIVVYPANNSSAQVPWSNQGWAFGPYAAPSGSDYYPIINTSATVGYTATLEANNNISVSSNNTGSGAHSIVNPGMTINKIVYTGV